MGGGAIGSSIGSTTFLTLGFFCITISSSSSSLSSPSTCSLILSTSNVLRIDFFASLITATSSSNFLCSSFLFFVLDIAISLPFVKLSNCFWLRTLLGRSAFGSGSLYLTPSSNALFFTSRFKLFLTLVSITSLYAFSVSSCICFLNAISSSLRTFLGLPLGLF